MLEVEPQLMRGLTGLFIEPQADQTVAQVRSHQEFCGEIAYETDVFYLPRQHPKRFNPAAEQPVPDGVG